MRFTGTLKSWNDQRGFGFIEPTDGGQPVFVHIKAFPPGSGRPALGQALSFEVLTGRDGKKKARALQYPVPGRSAAGVPRGQRAPARRRAEAPAPWTQPRRWAIPVFAVVCALVAWCWGVSPTVGLAYLGLSLLAFMAYALDKSAAQAGRWRTAENTLHLLALAGGWPGALVAQQLLRHKTSKPPFVAMFWLTVLLNVAGFVAWHAGLLPLPPPGRG